MSAEPLLLDAVPAEVVPDTEDPWAVLAWATDTFDARIALVTSLGPQTLVVLDMLHAMGRRVPVLMIDTGLLFPETLALRVEVQRRYGVLVRAVRPELTVGDQAATHGDALWERDPDACCRMRKVEPLGRALADFDAWITGIRRDQGPSRAGARAVEGGERERGRPPLAHAENDLLYGLVKVNPLVAWTRAQVDAYAAEHRLPRNALLDRGYRSIGCAPCTRPCAVGEDERAGRWAGTAKTECGIHLELTPTDFHRSLP